MPLSDRKIHLEDFGANIKKFSLRTKAKSSASTNAFKLNADIILKKVAKLGDNVLKLFTQKLKVNEIQNRTVLNLVNLSTIAVVVGLGEILNLAQDLVVILAGVLISSQKFVRSFKNLSYFIDVDVVPMRATALSLELLGGERHWHR